MTWFSTTPAIKPADKCQSVKVNKDLIVSFEARQHGNTKQRHTTLTSLRNARQKAMLHSKSQFRGERKERGFRLVAETKCDLGPTRRGREERVVVSIGIARQKKGGEETRTSKKH